MHAERGLEPGILNPEHSSRFFQYHSFPAGERLGAFVSNFWTVTWDLDEAYVAQVLPSPCVNLSVTNTEADVTGLVSARYLRRLEGRGFGVGARFRPACFRPFLSGPVAELTDTHRPIAEVLCRDTSALAQQVAATEDLEVRVHLLAKFLATDLPVLDPVAVRLAEVVEEVMLRPEIVRVWQVAELAGLSVRQLQRLFVSYVGAPPKWVIDRRRLQSAAAAGAADPDWADVADELGFADQAHLTRAFTATLGRPPGVFTREQPTSG
jgi:AraC-like DNA-binding protein